MGLFLNSKKHQFPCEVKAVYSALVSSLEKQQFKGEDRVAFKGYAS